MGYRQKEFGGFVKPPLQGKKGLWANMHAKRARGESPAKPGDKNYPTDEALKESQTPAAMKKCNCWDGYKRVPGTKPCAPGSCQKK
tara:strand:+ start:30289 stop:30546 length:258 start_codon:yes stop_codon:yes gene_type:complete